MNEVEILKQKQADIEKEINLCALSHGYKNMQPIYDGVCNPEKYLESNPKIMWILKEAYDGLDEDGNPIGGGWRIFKDWVVGNIEPTKSLTWQPMMYVLRALAENNNWDDVPWIWEERETYRYRALTST